MKYTDVMLDIETLGTFPGVAIMEIGAVLFNVNTGEISEKYVFQSTLNSQTQIDNGFKYNLNTIKWWEKENPTLFKKLRGSTTNYVKVGKEFQKWYRSLPNYVDLRIWGNSARFDIGILEGFYRKSIGFDFIPFWNSWNERCFRTINNLDPTYRNLIPFEGTKHDPLDDAKHQIKVLSGLVKKYKLKIY